MRDTNPTLVGVSIALVIAQILNGGLLLPLVTLLALLVYVRPSSKQDTC